MGIFLLPFYLFYIMTKWIVIPTAWLIGLLFPKTIEEAKGYAVERVNQAQGDADLFKQVFGAYQKAPEVTRKRIYLETIGKVLATQQRDDGNGGFVVEKSPRKIIMDQDSKGLLPLLNLNQEAK